MKNDPELEIEDDMSGNRTYSARKRRAESGSSNPLRIILVAFLVLIFVVGILYFLGKRLSGGDSGRLQSKVTALELRTVELEKQLAELQRKISTSGPDATILQRMDTLSERVEALEKEKRLATEPKAKQPAIESKAKPSPSPKAAAAAEKQYHTVQKGDSLYKISKKYGISVDELRKLNNLTAGQPLRSGQKLLVGER